MTDRAPQIDGGTLDPVLTFNRRNAAAAAFPDDLAAVHLGMQYANADHGSQEAQPRLVELVAQIVEQTIDGATTIGLGARRQGFADEPEGKIPVALIRVLTDCRAGDVACYPGVGHHAHPALRP